MKIPESYYKLKKDIKEHKNTLNNGSESIFKKKQIDKFFLIVKNQLNLIDKDGNLTDEEKDFKIKGIIELANTEWENYIKVKYSTGKNITSEKRKVNEAFYIKTFSDKINELDNKIVEDKAEKIKSISIDGSFEIPDDFNDLIEQFDDAIDDLKWKLKVSSGNEKKLYEDAIELLERNKKTLIKIKKDTDNISGSDIDDNFNDIVDKIQNSEGHGKITIEIFGANKTFKNKAEALATVKEMKIQIYEEMKSGWRSTFEVVSGIYMGILKGVNYLFLETGFNLGKDGLANIASLEPLSMLGGVFEEVAALGLGVVGISILATTGGMHLSVIESIYRRGFKDPMGYLGFMQYEDYGKKGINSNPVGDPSSKGYKDFFEYQQRDGLLEHFNQKLKALDNTSEEYKILKNNISILEKFKLNKTNTFYYIANKMSKEMKLGVMGNLDLKTLLFNLRRTFLDGGKIIGYNPLKKDADGKRFKWIRKDGKFQWPRVGGFEGHTINRTQNLYSDTMNMLKEMDDDLTEGVKTFYKNKEVETITENDTLKTKIEGDDEKTKEYKNIIDYIKNQPISDTKKEKLIKKFDRYIEKLGKELKYPKNIYKDVILLLNVDFQEPDEQLKKLTKEIEKIEAKFGLKESIQEKTPFIEKGNQRYNNYKEFRDLIAAGDWIGTEKEYDKAILEIEAGNKISANINTKIGTTDIESKFNDIIKEGKDSFEKSKILKKKLFDTIGDDIESSDKTQFLKNIEDYIAYKIDDNDIEKSVKKELKQYLEKVISDEILLESEDKLNIEIGKIIKGGLTENKLINKLDDSILTTFKNDQKQKVKDLIQEIINNPKTIITEKEINKIISEIENNNLQLANINHSNKIDLTTIKTDINDSEDMRKRDIRNKLNEISSDITKYIDDIKQTIDIDDSIKNKDAIKFELDKLQDSISKGSEYTHLQVLHIIDKIKQGEKFDNISKNTETTKYNELNDLIKPTSLKLLKNSIDNIEKNLSDIDDIKKLDELNKKIEELKENKFFDDLDKTYQDKLSDNFIKAQTEVSNIFKAKSINEQIDTIIQNQNYLSDFKKTKIKEFVNIIITTINELDTTSDKISKAELLKNSLTNDDIYTTRVKENIDDILKLKGISNLEKTFQGYKKQFENGNMKEYQKDKLIDKLDELIIKNQEIIDDGLRTQIEELKTEINDSMSNEIGRKSSTETTTTQKSNSESLSEEELTKKSKEFRNIFEAIKIELLLQGKDTKEIDDLINKANSKQGLNELLKETKDIIDIKMHYASKFKIDKIRDLDTLNEILDKFKEIDANKLKQTTISGLKKHIKETYQIDLDTLKKFPTDIDEAKKVIISLIK